MFKETASFELKISSWTILKIIAIILGVGFLYFIRDIIGILLVALIFASVIDPAVDWFEKKKIPRPIGVIIIYIIFFSFLTIIVGLLVPPLIKEIRELMINFSYLWNRIVLSAVGFREYAGVSIFPQAVEKTLATLESALTQAIKGAFATVANLFGGLVSFVAILVLTFYLTVQEDALKKNFYYFVPPSYLSLLTNLFGEIKRKISSWVRGQFILCFAVGLAVYLGLLVLGVHYALLLGIFAGITEIIPYAGPFIGGAVAVFFALAQSPFKAFLVMILCILVQQLENNILVPKIMQKAVGLNPIITIIALLIGYRLAGIPGGLLAIPVAASLDLAFRTLLRKESPSS